MNLSIEDRAERLSTLISEGRIIRNSWTGIDKQGRETACLLAALSPEAGESENADFCPAAVMPTWFAHLTPWLDDACSDTEWPRVIRRYAACAARWSVLDDAAWRRVEIVARRVAVVEAMRHTSDAMALDACRRVLAWLDADMPEEVCVTIEKEIVGVAYLAVSAASRVAGATTAAWSAAWAAVEMGAVCAKREAADRITDEILSALETECGL